MDNFIDFLDNYKQKKNINYYDFVNITNSIQEHYKNSNYDNLWNSSKKLNTTGKFNNYNSENKENLYKWDIKKYDDKWMQAPSVDGWSTYINKDYLSNTVSYGCSQGLSPELALMMTPSSNYTNLSAFTKNDFTINKNQKKNRFPLYTGTPTDSIIKTPKKEKMDIDFDINTIDDLIKLIDANPYKEDIEYNIDLKGLHNIKSELVELNSMIGIDSLKKSVLNQLIYFIQEPILSNNIKDYKHTILCGPPGTGKTEIAKILGQMYSKFGILKKNTFKKVTRNDLIAGYLGQTAIKTKEVIEKCLGGCLFIDEAYSLGHVSLNDSFSKECVDTLCEAMSDYKDDLMVIIAGYEDELNDTFFSINPGLKSRFVWKFKIENYTPKELCQIFEKKVKDIDWKLDEKYYVSSLNWFETKKDKFKHYGRDIEKLLYYIKICHARRIYGKSKDQIKLITMDDINKGYTNFIENRSEKEQIIPYGLYL